MSTLSTNKARYEELMKNPLLFLHKKKGEYWEALKYDYQGRIDEDEFEGNRFGYELVIAKQSKSKPSSENENVYFSVHAVDASNIDDWFVVFQSYNFRSRIKDDKYPYIHLLWMLNYREWRSENIVNTLNRFDVKEQPYLIKALSKICKCLSVVKQQQIKEALSFFNFNYNVYYPEVIKKAVNILFPKPIWESKQNLFQLVDSILNERNSSNYAIIRNEQPNNIILQLFRWLHDESVAIMDYSSLNSIYSLSSYKIQMDIVKRYFHDIRQGKTSLDIQLLEQFRDSKFSEFIRYRYCLYSPEEPINISVPLLCDSILTVYQTVGQSFQSFDGVLDFVVAHCDVTKPNINLGMDEFIPKCNGGAVINSSFLGFIDYSLVCELDESKFTPENMQATIRKMLDKRPHNTYYVCRNDNERYPLSEKLIQQCKRFNCEGLSLISCENKWVINDKDYGWVNTFLKEPIPALDKNTGSHNTIVIDIEQTSTDVLEKHIRSLVDCCEKAGDGLFVIESIDDIEPSLLRQFSKPIAMRIIPVSFPVLGLEFDFFGIKKALCEKNNIDPNQVRKTDTEINDHQDIINEFEERESSEVQKRVIESLKKELNPMAFNGEFFEVSYDKDLLSKLKKLYYFNLNRTDSDENKDQYFNFLRSKSNYSFCAPKLSEIHNVAIDFPYFWCRGLECFQNCLNDQTVENCSSWKEYSLYHMIEILGFPKLKKTEAGFEPDETVKEFIACANRAIKKFNQLKCRACGHLLFTEKNNGFNRYNYYSCINPSCSEYNHAIYLNQCFKCKTVIIDSRDSKQCPNGWYICPECHSCCDDAQYERLAQRYILEKRFVPQRIENKRGQGHNDKGIYFCHKCGEQLIHEEDQLICKKCEYSISNH